VKTCAVLWGYGKREDLAKWEPDYWVAHPSELCSDANSSKFSRAV
jgi:phosphoglycolate phosphatase-like HAD superfamily hydrolase